MRSRSRYNRRRLIDNFRYRIRRKFLHVKRAYYLVIKLQLCYTGGHVVAHDDDKSSLCSLPQLRFAIMENCRRAFRTIIHFIHVQLNATRSVPPEIAYSLRIKNG